MATALDRWDGEGGAPAATWSLPYEAGGLLDMERRILECLGAALVSEWNSLPTDIQRKLFEHATLEVAINQIRDATASHEVGHEWFYGLIGDDQARDPWLDESFATYAEALDRGTGPTYERMTIPSGGRGQTGRPMTFWESRQSIYFRSVYIQGAWGRNGGTSAAAPLWASYLTLINQRAGILGKLRIGQLNPKLYALSGVAVNDVTVGDNRFYQAGSGFDMATGWGSPARRSTTTCARWRPTAWSARWGSVRGAGSPSGWSRRPRRRT